MKVKCIQNEIGDVFAKNIGLAEGEPRLYRSISRGKEYKVLGITFDPSNSCYAGAPAVEVRNDMGDISIVPLFMFDVIEASASKHWKIKYEAGALKLLPESFYAEFYHDDLSEGVMEVVEDFNEICKKIDIES